MSLPYLFLIDNEKELKALKKHMTFVFEVDTLDKVATCFLKCGP